MRTYAKLVLDVVLFCYVFAYVITILAVNTGIDFRTNMATHIGALLIFRIAIHLKIY